MDISLKVNRLLEDIFNPMSPEEQADVESQFETTYGVLVDLNIKVEYPGLDWRWVRRRLIDLLRDSGFETRYEEVILGYGNANWRRSTDSHEDACYLRDKLAGEVLKKLENLGIAAKFHYRGMDEYSKEIDIRLDLPLADNVREPILLNVSNERKRIKLSEDLFQPMKGKELKHVSSLTYKGKYIQVNIDFDTLENNLSRSIILEELQETCRVLGLNKENRHMYTKEGKNIAVNSIAKEIEDKLREIGVFVKRRIDKDEYGVTIDFLCNDFGRGRTFIAVSISSGDVIINKKTGRTTEIEEDIFQPMSEPERKEVEKQVETINRAIFDVKQHGGTIVINKIIKILVSNGFKSNVDLGGEGHYGYDAFVKDRISSPEMTKLVSKIAKNVKGLYLRSYTSDADSFSMQGEFIYKVACKTGGFYTYTPAVFRVEKITRKKITEDIFQPMSEPEQAEVEKNFEYRIGIAIHNPHTEDGSMIRDFLISNGFIYSPSVISGTGYYHKAADSTQAWSSEVNKIINRIKETGQHAFFKSGDKWAGNIYIGPYGYPTLPDITVRGERIKKK